MNITDRGRVHGGVRLTPRGRLGISAGRLMLGDYPTNYAAAYTLVNFVRSDLGITITSGKVSAWADQSGAGNDWTQGTAGQRPTLSATAFNGSPAVRFDPNANQNLRADGMADELSGTNTPFTVIVALQNIDITRTGATFGATDVTTVPQLALRATTAAGAMGAFHRDDTGVTAITRTTTQTCTTATCIMRWTFNGTTLAVHRDGVVTSLSASAFAVGATTFTEVTMGCGPALTDTSDVYIRQFMAFATAVPASVALAIENGMRELDEIT